MRVSIYERSGRHLVFFVWETFSVEIHRVLYMRAIRSGILQTNRLPHTGPGLIPSLADCIAFKSQKKN